MNQLNFDVVNLPSSMLDEAQAKATQLITQAMGGYVYKTNSELYIMDNPDPAQAVKVWRWNINGLGYSSTGINGTYGIAMTMDGSIVADFITTGQLNANVISASTIIGVINGNTSQLKLDADQIDLTATDVLNILAGNSLNLTSKNITIDSTNFSVDANGNMTCSNATINDGKIEVIDNGLSTQIPLIRVIDNNGDYGTVMYSYGTSVHGKNHTGNIVGTINSTGANSMQYDSNNKLVKFSSFVCGNGFTEEYMDVSNDNVIRHALFSSGEMYADNMAIELYTAINGNFHRNFVVTNKDSGNYMNLNGEANIYGNLTVGGTATINNLNANNYISDTAWQNISLPSGLNAVRARIRKVGKTVMLDIRELTGWVSTTTYNSFIPDGYRPSGNLQFAVPSQNAGTSRFEVNADGSMYIQKASVTTNGAWLSADITWFID